MVRKFYRDYVFFTVILLSVMLGIVLLFNRLFSPAISVEQSNNIIYVIDAGHGGEDGGAVSVTGECESRYNLQIAICMNDLLNLLGYETHMMRTTDSDLHTQGNTIAQRKVSDLKQRVKTVNQFEYAKLISIHQNYFSDSRYTGLQTFYYNASSKELAECIQASYKSYIAPDSRRLAQRKTGVYLLERVHCDAVLVECGFISNREEEALLKSTAYQQKLSAVIVSAIALRTFS